MWETFFSNNNTLWFWVPAQGRDDSLMDIAPKQKWPGLLPAIFIVVVTSLSAAVRRRAGAAAATPVRR